MDVEKTITNSTPPHTHTITLIAEWWVPGTGGKASRNGELLLNRYSVSVLQDEES